MKELVTLPSENSSVQTVEESLHISLWSCQVVSLLSSWKLCCQHCMLNFNHHWLWLSCEIHFFSETKTIYSVLSNDVIDVLFQSNKIHTTPTEGFLGLNSLPLWRFIKKSSLAPYSRTSCKWRPKMQRLSGRIREVVAYKNQTTGSLFQEEV